MVTREYPPNVYGGAGVHVEYLARELARLVPVEVRRFGAPDGEAPPEVAGAPSVRSYPAWSALAGDPGYSSALEVMSTDLAMASGMEGATVVHSHTWYANLAGHLAKLLYGIPHVATTHSLEPLRPWKAEQLGPGGYALSCFCERTGLEGADAIVAVSGAMRDDLTKAYPGVDPERVTVIHNGIDPDEFRPERGTATLDRLGIDAAAPMVLFVGRIARQKGIPYLLRAAERFREGTQLVLAAGSPDEAEIDREVTDGVGALRDRGAHVTWIQSMLPRPDLIELLSHATALVCPSLYEPLGIVNLEAMACGTAVVATGTGGIPEVVEDGVTGWLVPFNAADARGTPTDPGSFVGDLADRVNDLIDHPDRAAEFGREGRSRVVERFTWEAVARRTLELYRRVGAA